MGRKGREAKVVEEVTIDQIANSYVFDEIDKEKILKMGFNYSNPPTFEKGVDLSQAWYRPFPKFIVELIREPDENYPRLRLILGLNIELPGRNMLINSMPDDERYKLSKKLVPNETIVPLLIEYMARVKDLGPLEPRSDLSH
jgi:hypothetical protein